MKVRIKEGELGGELCAIKEAVEAVSKETMALHMLTVVLSQNDYWIKCYAVFVMVTRFFFSHQHSNKSFVLDGSTADEKEIRRMLKFLFPGYKDYSNAIFNPRFIGEFEVFYQECCERSASVMMDICKFSVKHVGFKYVKDDFLYPFIRSLAVYMDCCDKFQLQFDMKTFQFHVRRVARRRDALS